MNLLRDYLKGPNQNRSESTCPEAYELWQWSQDKVDSDKRENLLTHAHECAACMEKLVVMKDIKMNSEGEISMPQALEKRIKTQRPGHAKRSQEIQAAWQRHIWFVAFVIFIGASFVVKPYFAQLLVAAIVAAGKWLLDTRAHHTRIAIFQKSESDKSQETHASRISGRKVESDV